MLKLRNLFRVIGGAFFALCMVFATDSAWADYTCDPGYYLEKNATTCTICPAGHYCPGGTWTSNARMRGYSDSWKVSAGYFCTGGCASATPNTTPGGVNGNGSNGCISGYSCGLISAGYYGEEGATSNEGSGMVSAGYYSTGGCTSATPVGDYMSTWHDCIGGQTCGLVNGGYYNNGGGTSATPTSAGNGCISGKSCGKVATGYYSSAGGTTSTPTSSGCASRPVGTASTCGSCSSYHSGSTTSSTGSTSSSACLCPAGKYLSGTSCVDTSAGYYSSGLGDSQTACGAGTYSTGGASSCSPISSGYYGTGCDGDDETCTGQSKCTAGYYCSSGVRYLCAAGKYSAAGATSCTDVNAGYFCTGGCTSATPNTTVGGQSGTGSNGCISGKSCGIVRGGYYSTGGGTSATPNASGDGCVSSKSCGKVAKGYYSNGGGTSATPTSSNCISGRTCGACMSTYTTASTGTASPTSCYRTSTDICSNVKPYRTLSVSNGSISYVKADGTATSDSATIDAIQYQANASTNGPLQAKNPWQCVTGGVTCNVGYSESIETGVLPTSYGVSSSSTVSSWSYHGESYDSGGWGAGQVTAEFNSGNTILYIQSVIASDASQTVGNRKDNVSPISGSSGSCWCRLTAVEHNGLKEIFTSPWISTGGSSTTIGDCSGACGAAINYNTDVLVSIVNYGSRRSCNVNTITIKWTGVETAGTGFTAVSGESNAYTSTVTYGGNITTPVSAITSAGQTFMGWRFVK